MNRIKGMICVLTALLLLGLPVQGSSGKEDTRVLKNELFETAEIYIRTHKPWKDSEICIKRDYARELELPAGDVVRLEASELQYSKPWGKLLVPVTVYRNGQEWRRVQVYLKVDMVGTVAMAIRNIRHLEPLTSSNIKFIRIPLARVPHNTILNPAGIDNMQAKGTIRAGTIINSGMVLVIPDIRKGDRIRLKVNNKGFMVTTMGRAKEDGFNGERIKVVNLRSNKIVTGIVRDKKCVEILN